MYPEYSDYATARTNRDVMFEIQEKIYIAGLKKIQDYHTFFRYESPINNDTEEILCFEEWFKTIKFDNYDMNNYMPDYIKDHLGRLAIKDLFVPYFKEIYTNYITAYEEDKAEKLKAESEVSKDAE